MRELAAEHGGECLSTEYAGHKTALDWQCAKHHVWRTTPHVILHGSWCPECAKTKKLKIKDLQRIARMRGGQLLSRVVSANEPLWWTCAEGHIWRAKASKVKGNQYTNGSWCALCAIRARRGWLPHFNTIEEMKEIARKRGGECLSESYVNSKTKLKWRCAKGHEWMAAPPRIKSGAWCSICGHRQKEYHDAARLASERGGNVITSAEQFVSGSTVLVWECEHGHQWRASTNQTKWRWCPECLPVRPGTLEEMKATARQHGGECLSKRYVNSLTPLRWRCSKGHVWMARPHQMKAYGYAERGHWCAACYHESTKTKTIEDMRRLARERGGECLSAKYVDGQTALRWRCSVGHIWNAIPHHVVAGGWCRKCAYSGRRLSIEQVQAFARSHGGECLSKNYVNNDTPMRWRCSQGHTWTQPLSYVKIRLSRPNGVWCIRCDGRWSRAREQS